MNLFYCRELQQPLSILNESESHHCVNVLRKRVGDNIILFNGKGSQGTGIITQATKKKVIVSIENITTVEPPSYSIHIAIVPTKQNDRIEWFLEKATELGIHEITFLESEHSERRNINIDRFKRRILSAAKQSFSYYLPVVHDLTPFSVFIEKGSLADEKLIATLHEKSRSFNKLSLYKKKILLCVGPEGGFTRTEVELAESNGYTAIHMGKKRLRTETAALLGTAIMYAQHLNE